MPFGPRIQCRQAASGVRPVAFAIIVLVALFASTAPVSAQNNQDSLVLVTGVALVGEIKSAVRGSVSFDNDELDVVEVDVEDITRLSSPSFFEVRDVFGGQFLGSLAAGDSGTVVVTAPGLADTLNLIDVVELLAIDRGFWARTNGYLDFGANVAQANSLSSVLLNGLAAYRGPKWGANVTMDGYHQRQTAESDDGVEFDQTTNRLSVGSTLSRYLALWAIQGSGDWEKNEELDLVSRVQFGLQGIYSLIENRSLELRTGAGLVNNTEAYVGEETVTSAELKVGVTLDIFDMGDVDVYTSFATFTNLNDEGRYRLNLDSRVSWEFVDDFTIGFTVLEQYDSRPGSDSAVKRDYQYGLTLGWTWS